MELHEFELWRDRGEETPLIIRGEARIPADAAGTVVICHGFKGFAHFAFFPYLAGKLAEAGLRAITFDFSGSGIGDDRENFTNPLAFTHNTYLQELDDLEAVIGEAQVHDWIEGPYGLFGHSRGGGIAILHAARDQNVAALATWAAISSTNRWAPEVLAEWRQRGFVDIVNSRTGQTIPLSIELLHEVEEYGGTKLNISAAAGDIEIPWLVLHGSTDETVPVSEGQTLANLSPSATLRVVDGANHTFGGVHPLKEISPILEATTRETVEFFAKNLGASRV